MTDFPFQPHLLEMAEQWRQTLDWQPTPSQQAQFQQLYDHILAGNRSLNLTRITDPLEFWEKHLWDSLRGIQTLLNCPSATPDSTRQSHPYRVIDIGTGAGFPGIPVAIARPDWQVVLLDSTRKKLEFIRQMLAEMGINNASPLVGRAEQVGQSGQHRSTYDLALIRAVAAAAVCAEYALPLLKPGGLAILYRGQWTEAETQALQPVVQQLGGRIEQIEGFKTPLTQSDRHCLLLRKVAPTAASFPRAIGIPAQKPLA